MSPDSPHASPSRRVWRVISCVAAILAAFAVFAAVWLYSRQQTAREETVRLACEQTNDSHDKTVKTLDQLLAIRRRTASPRQLQRLNESRTNTLLLIDALAPKRDCAERVAQLVSQHP